MRTIWHSLVWKEWHEHKWKMGLLTTITLLLVLLASQDDFIDLPTTFSAFLIPYMLCSSFFVATGVAASERSGRTLPFVQALPDSPWKLALVKLMAGILTTILPPLVVLGLIYVFGGGWTDHDSPLTGILGSHGWLTAQILAIFFVPVSISLWTVAAGVNSESEVRAAIWGLLAIVIAWFIAVNLGMLWNRWFGNVWPRPPMAFLLGALPGCILAVRPQNFGGALSFSMSATLACLGFLIVHGALFRWYLTRFGKTGGNAIFSAREAATNAHRAVTYPLSFRSQFAATAWKQLRESGTLGLAGLSGIFIFAGLAAVWLRMSQEFSTDEPTLAELMAQMLFAMCICIGSVTVLIIGIGTFFYELEPRLYDFWRSRPINTHLWFWIRYLTGLIVVLVVLNTPFVAALALMDDVRPYPRDQQTLFYSCVMAAEVAFYSTAVALICLVRRAVYASILSIGAVVLTGTAIEWFTHQPSLLFLFAVYCTGAIATTIVAWLSLRYDWGWQR